MVRDRLEELQQKSKHVKPSDLQKTNEEELKTLKQKDKAMSGSQEGFFDALDQITTNINKVSNYFLLFFMGIQK